MIPTLLDRYVSIRREWRMDGASGQKKKTGPNAK